MVRFRTASHLAVVAAAALICYVNILPNDFCYDDIPVVRDNPNVQSEGHWDEIWTTDYWSQSQTENPHRDLLYRPIALSFFRIMRMLFGRSPLPFHLASMILHALCSVLVYRLVDRLSGPGKPALVAGLVFAVLPIHSEVVASVVGQTDLLATVGVLGVLLCHFRFTKATLTKARLAWAGAAATFAFIAMGAKESGIAIFPVVVVAELLGVVQVQSKSSAFLESPRTGLFRRLVRTAYLGVPLGGYLVLRYFALGAMHQSPAPTKTVNVLVDAPPWQHVLGVLQAWGLYWSKTIFPRELCIEYAINAVRLATSCWQAHVLIGTAWMIGLLGLSVRAWRRGQRHVLYLIVCLLIAYLPTSNAFVLIQVFFAERIWYLPSVFVCCLFGLCAARWLDRRIWKTVGIALIVAMMVRVWVRNNDWRSNESLFAATQYDHPQSVMARYLYGQWLAQNGREEEGIALLERAIEIDLGFTDAHRALGFAWLRLGHADNALKHLRIAEMQAPGHAATRQALARSAGLLNADASTQIRDFEASVSQEGSDPDSQLAAIRMLRELGRTEQALALLYQHASRFPQHADGAYETAVTLVYLNRRDEAIDAYRRAIVLRPTPQSQVELGMLLLERREGEDVKEARSLVERAIARQPRTPPFHAAMGEILSLQGDRAGAQKSFRKAVELTDPASEYARVLNERMKTLGL